MNVLIGNTGLVGSVLKERIKFDYEFNSKNINEAEALPNGCNLYLACLPATKWLVNKEPLLDLLNMFSIINRIKHISFSRIFLFSTIDVYNNSEVHSDEDTILTFNALNYGNNRYLFEILVNDSLKYEDLKILRLPALYHKNIKKNILFDLLNNNNVDKIPINSSFQWYNLNNIFDDLEYFITTYPNQKIFNLFTEPIKTKNIIELFPQYIDINFSNQIILNYDYKTKYCGYILDSQHVYNDIKKFINEYSNK